MHPMHPDHPDYQGLVDAGRAGSVYNRTGYTPEPEPQPTTCREWIEDRDGARACGAPAPFLIARSDGLGVTSRFCDLHARARLGHQVPFDSREGARVYWIVAAFLCSVCDAPADYRSRLDHDGRCDRCRP